MKKIIYSTLLVALMAVNISASFGQEVNRKSMKARVKLNVTHEKMDFTKLDLMAAQEDSIPEFQKFKHDAELKIAGNEKNISDWKEKQLGLDKTNEKYMEKISKLEQKNNDLKIALENYKDEGPVKWAIFKNKFKQDIDELEKALKNHVHIGNNE